MSSQEIVKKGKRRWQISSLDQADTVGKRIRFYRSALGWTAEGLAEKTEIDPSQLSKYENDQQRPREAHLIALADAFGIILQHLTVGRGSIGPAPQKINPKPVRFGDQTLDNVFLMCGNHTETVEIGVRYKPEPLKIPRKIRPYYSELIERKKQDARQHGYPHFNGPNTRLLRITEENTRQLPNGKEQRGLVLELGPVSWEEFVALNESMDIELFDGKQKTIRSVYASEPSLYRNNPDLRWCKLANLFTVALTPITNDGFGLVCQRSIGGVSNDFGQLSTGIAENIQRFHDEAPPENLAHRLNKIDYDRGVDANYRPTGVPSPLLAAQRGLYEEISTELYRRMKDSPNRYKFLNVFFGLHLFQPVLVGVIELDIGRDETEEIIQEYPGRDHSEHTGIQFLPLDLSHKRTREAVANRNQWASTLAGFVSALQYWQAKKADSDL